MLRITIHEEPESLTFQLAGSLIGTWVREFETCWQRTLATSSKPVVRVDLREVTYVNGAGKALLVKAHAQGAEFIASGCQMKAIVAELSEVQRCL